MKVYCRLQIKNEIGLLYYPKLPIHSTILALAFFYSFKNGNYKSSKYFFQRNLQSKQRKQYFACLLTTISFTDFFQFIEINSIDFGCLYSGNTCGDFFLKKYKIS